MTIEETSYRDGEIDLKGTLYRPSGTARAAVAVFPTIMNPTPAVEAKARALAGDGFLAMICDFYGATPADFAQAQEWARALVSKPDTHRARLRAGLATLRQFAPDMPMGAIGFCMGGQAVLELARDGADLFVVASFHGLLETLRPAEEGAIKARILVCHGDADTLVPRDHVIAFWEEMDRAGANWHFHSYSGVPHGFTNPNPSPTGAVAFDASADRQSWAALMSLLDEELG